MAKDIAIIGGGPSGLMAAEVLSEAGHSVTVYEAMPTVGRKFLLAGKSGLNLTHAEDYERFVTRFGAASARLRPALDRLTPTDLQQWAEDLGSPTFVGSSGRVFPKVMKASPLLRAWLRRLEGQGVQIRTRHRWTGFSGEALAFETPEGRLDINPSAALLALGGASWPRLGSDAKWVPWLLARGVDIAPFRPANCGFERSWSLHFRERFAGAPIKAVIASSDAGAFPGEFVISTHGIEGSLVYAHAAALRDQLERGEKAMLTLDLAPGRTLDRLVADLRRQDKKQSFSTRLRKATGIDGVKVSLIREVMPDAAELDMNALAQAIKALPLGVDRPRPIDEAISSAGGVRLDAVDDHFMLQRMPGIFVAGEMLDWEAPTGGYLLTACMAMGQAAGRGIARWVDSRQD